MLTSKASLGIFAAHFCGNWGLYLFLTQMPTYLKEVLRFDIKSVCMSYLFKKNFTFANKNDQFEMLKWFISKIAYFDLLSCINLESKLF